MEASTPISPTIHGASLRNSAPIVMSRFLRGQRWHGTELREGEVSHRTRLELLQADLADALSVHVVESARVERRRVTAHEADRGVEADAERADARRVLCRTSSPGVGAPLEQDDVFRYSVAHPMVPQPPPSSALVDYLKATNPLHYGKVAELRAEITRWLTYVPQTFGHYTSHTIDHADEIVLQISKLLFAARAPQPTIQLSAVEAYILIAGAYLHDAGMVTPDDEKAAILGSNEWKQWTMIGGGAVRWREIEALRKQAGNDPLRNFTADRLTRLLIAEYVRRQHHQRAGELIRGRSLELGRADYAEPMLRTAIAEICVAHGLDLRDLEDDYRFPEARDILGERVNLRLLATLLRLGDLLDMRYDRACPLLLQAACPLPADSLAHWSQYEAIEHRMTDPNRIEIRAACRTQEEHRVLHDWCSWLVKEIESLPARLIRTEWRPPKASMRGTFPSIEIRPAPAATYIPGDWKLELDHDAVLERFISDAYDSPMVFVRELIQNALDATRCRMYADIQASGREPPEYPTDVPETFRNKYSVQVSLHDESVKHPETGESEVVQVLSIEDQGIGMDIEVIRRYLLQVGRSYYTTAEFRRAFKFHPTSRFGVGFLSVFGVSDDIRIETFRPGSKDGPINLRLTGPRSYILAEAGSRISPGTRVIVRLRKALIASLEEIVREHCVFVEFPIEVNDRGKNVVVLEEKCSDLEVDWQHPLDSKMRYIRRVFPFSSSGVRGNLSVIARLEDGKERWVSSRDMIHTGLLEIPKPLFWPRSVVAIQGIRVSDDHSVDQNHLLIRRFDVRQPVTLNMNRREAWPRFTEPDLTVQLEEILCEHLGTDDHPFDLDDWYYRIRLSLDQRLGALPMWKRRRDMIPIWRCGRFEVCSSEDLLSHPRLYVFKGQFTRPWEDKKPPVDLPETAVFLSSEVLDAYYGVRQLIISRCNLVGIVKLDRSHCVLEYEVDREQNRLDNDWFDMSFFAGLVDAPSYAFDLINFGLLGTVLNIARPFGQWYQRVRAILKSREDWTSRNVLMGLSGAIGRGYGHSHSDLHSYLKEWNYKYASVPELLCPSIELIIGEPKEHATAGI